ncbi:MAG TPA: 3-deoxy-8-phosphooctulonate synthase [Acidobacteriota bacterium]|nr:3-deoxy-8-phosphooctulonate synthase [Acidobacteriota bacterium]
MEAIRLRDWALGGGTPFFLIAGPCVIESENHCLGLAEQLKQVTDRLGVPFIFKASFDKANRTSVTSYRGPGLVEGMRILSRVKEELGVPLISDIHEAGQAALAAEVLDIIQIPAFLCRQTDLILAAASTGSIVNIKKGQFVSPWDVEQIVRKVESVGNEKLLLTERGSAFGYNNLVVDFKSIPVMRSFGYPVVFDATHSVQLPGGSGTQSSGQAQFIPYLAKAAVAVGVDGLFFEVHETPEKALSDAANALPLSGLEDLLTELKSIDGCAKAHLSS